MINTKDNIYVVGYDFFKLYPIIDSKVYNRVDIIYRGKTSDIPKEIAKECVDKIYYTANNFCYKDYSNPKETLKDGIKSVSIGFESPKEAIQSALTKPDGTVFDFCIIFKK